MKRNTILIFSIAALALSACGDDDGRMSTTDGGEDASTDAPINTPDAPVNGDASSTPDASDNRTRACGMMPSRLSAFADEPMCAAETEGCLTACGEAAVACIEEAEGQADQQACLTAAQECEDVCLEADETVTTLQTQGGAVMFDCGDCLLYETFACLYENGCDTAIADANCCVQDKCAGAADQQACANAMCAAEGQAQQQCLFEQGEACGDTTSACFPGGGMSDGGVGDAGADAGA